MGYIMPVANYQYADYQKRVTADKKDIIHIEKPFKAVLETQYEEIHQSADQEAYETKDSPARKSRNYAYKPAMLPKVLANLTGKGQYFSETV